MRLFVMSAFLVFALTAHAAALSLQDAERHFIQDNPELAIKRAELQASSADALGAGLVPNPSAKYTRERLGAGNGAVEESFSLSQVIGLWGERGLRIEAAKRTVEARRLFHEQDTALALARMKQRYYRILLLRENAATLGAIVSTFEDMERKTAERLKAGDVAEAEVMRLASERKKYAWALAGVRAEAEREQQHLAQALGLQDDSVDPTGSFAYRPVRIDTMRLQQEGLAQRPDLRARAELVRAREAAVSLASRQGLPDLEIEAGYKRTAAGLDGYVAGLSVSLPIFDRNQASRAASRAELHAERYRSELLKKSVRSEIAVIADKIRYLMGRIEEMTAEGERLREISHISRLSYEEGEAGIMDLLDSARSEGEFMIARSGVVYEYYAALFDLEAATGDRPAQGAEE